MLAATASLARPAKARKRMFLDSIFASRLLGVVILVVGVDRIL
jgi:hypothetical protein